MAELTKADHEAVRRILQRDRENPNAYQSPESFDRLFTPDQKAFVLSGWGGADWRTIDPKRFEDKE